MEVKNGSGAVDDQGNAFALWHVYDKTRKADDFFLDRLEAVGVHKLVLREMGWPSANEFVVKFTAYDAQGRCITGRVTDEASFP